MSSGALLQIQSMPGWVWRPLWSIAPRVKETGRPTARPLSVYLEAGVVPRDTREDNRNQLGEDLAKYLVVRRGDLVFNKLRTWQGGLGVSRHDGIVSPAYFVCRPRSGVEPRFLHYLLRSTPYLTELARISKWMPPSQFDTPWENLRRLPILLPALDEQRRIADFLDGELNLTSKVVRARERQIRNLTELSYSTLSEKLIPGILTRPLGKGLFSWLPALPPSFRLIKLGYVCRLQSGLTVDGKRDLSGDVVTRPYLRVANVQSGQVNLDQVAEVTVPRDIASRCTLQAGDVLVTEGGDLDKLGRGTVWNGELPGCLHQNHVFALRPNARYLDGRYLAFMTQTLHGRSYFESTGVKTTNLASTSSGKILSFPIPLPEVGAQRALVNDATNEVFSVS